MTVLVDSCFGCSSETRETPRHVDVKDVGKGVRGSGAVWGGDGGVVGWWGGGVVVDDSMTDRMCSLAYEPTLGWTRDACKHVQPRAGGGGVNVR